MPRPPILRPPRLPHLLLLADDLRSQLVDAAAAFAAVALRPLLQHLRGFRRPQNASQGLLTLAVADGAHELAEILKPRPQPPCCLARQHRRPCHRSCCTPAASSSPHQRPSLSNFKLRTYACKRGKFRGFHWAPHDLSTPITLFAGPATSKGRFR